MRQRQADASTNAPERNARDPRHVIPSRNHAEPTPSSLRDTVSLQQALLALDVNYKARDPKPTLMFSPDILEDAFGVATVHQPLMLVNTQTVALPLLIASAEPDGARLSARRPHLPRAFEAERALGRFGEVVFATRHIRPAVDHRHAQAVPVVAQRHERATRQRLVGDT
jgi:hypothetical protein